MRILCLHGSGTNVSIFRMQTAALRYDLEKDGVSFEFIEGGLRCRPAEEIASLFPDISDFFAYYDPRDAESIIEAQDELLEMLMERKGEFDGVLAFSEAAALAAALIVRYARENPFKAEGLFRFAIFACGLAPFDYDSLNDITRTKDYSNSTPKRVTADSILSTGSYLINIPTFHIMGRKDTYFEYGKTLYQCCNPQMAIKMIHDGGHHIPNHPVELVKEVTRNIKDTITRAEFMC
ncbi:serine hydrolase FSH [Xylogone sp. PMI_703]|nr:serine hydrolase FSH [Xylogone sp. PMI_703]